MNPIQMVAFLCLVLLLWARGPWRLTVFALTQVLFPVNMTVILKPVNIYSHVFFSFAYFVSVFLEIGLSVRLLRLKAMKASLVYAAVMFAVAIVDSRLPLFNKVARPMMAWFSFCAIFPLLLWDAEKIRSPRRVAIAISGMVILALGYAFVCKITGSNIYHLKIGEFSPAPDIANIYMSANERFRVSSFFAHPMDFALMCSFSLLLIGLLREKGAVSKGVMILMFGLTAYGVMLGNSRLPMLLWLISVGVMFLFSGLVRLPIAVKFLTIMVALIAGLAFTSGGEDDFVGQTLRMFNSEQAVRGSSVGMRINQLGMSVSFASTRPIFGHGLGYISENMNFTVNEDGNAEGVEEDFAGFESILFSVPIEEGYLGLATYFFFYIAIGRIAMSMVGNPFRIYALAILGLFVVYQIGTGMLGSAPLAFVSIAVALALASHRDDANALNHSRQRAPAT